MYVDDSLPATIAALYGSDGSTGKWCRLGRSARSGNDATRRAPAYCSNVPSFHSSGCTFESQNTYPVATFVRDLVRAATDQIRMYISQHSVAAEEALVGSTARSPIYAPLSLSAEVWKTAFPSPRAT
jgi:hypothetical protein